MDIKRRFSSGFTLIELLMVIAIIGVLASLTIVSLRGAGAKARDAKVKTNAASIDKALSQFEIDNKKYFVDTTSATIDISPTSALATALSSYVRSGVFAVVADKAAKYTTNTSGSSFAMSWELENTTESPVTSGSGVYVTNSANLAGKITTAPSTISSGVSMDGTTNLLALDPSDLYTNRPQLSVLAWVNYTTNNNYERVIGKYWYSGGNTGSWVLQFGASGGVLSCNMRIDATFVTINSATDIGAGQWRHVACVYDGTRTRLYLDGVQVSQSGVVSGNVTTTDPGYRLSIGDSCNANAIPGCNNRFKGLIDDVRIYSTGLSQDAIQTIMNGVYDTALIDDSVNLIGGWSLDEVSGSTTTNIKSGGASVAPSIGLPSWVDAKSPLSLNGIGSSLTGRAFVVYRPQ